MDRIKIQNYKNYIKKFILAPKIRKVSNSSEWRLQKLCSIKIRRVDNTISMELMKEFMNVGFYIKKK